MENDSEFLRNDNRVISSFVGSTILREYHKSWDKLMPVIKKIRQMDETHLDKRGTELIDAICKNVGLVKIKETHVYVASFITWYNSVKK